MKPHTLPLFQEHNGVNPYRFLIVVSPPPEIAAFASYLKTEFYETYGSYESRWSKPHITVCHFLLLEERQDKVLSVFQNGVLKIDPFILELNGFGSFTGSNVIYLNVEKSYELDSLIHRIGESAHEVRLGTKFTLIENSHLTIAKKLGPGIFKSARSDYLGRPYRNSFVVDKLKILRYDFHEGRYSDLGDLRLGA